MTSPSSSPSSIALGLLELAAEVVRAHAVRLVDDDEIPVGALEPGLQFFVAGELVHPSDEQRVLLERVAVDAGVDHLPA